MQELVERDRAVVRLDAGEELMEGLAAFATRHHIRAGVVVEGIGMLRTTTLGYWNGREYAPRTFEDPRELIALHGSLAEEDGRPSVHLHAAVSGKDHAVHGGHLLAGTVGVLAEIFVVQFPEHRFGRPLDESFGLRRLDLHPGP